MIGSRYYQDALDSIIDLVDGDELILLDAGQAVQFVQHYRERTRVDLSVACMLWNTLRIRIGYEQAPEVTP